MFLKNQRNIYRLLVPALVAMLALSIGSAVIASGHDSGTAYYACLKENGNLTDVNTDGPPNCKKDRAVSWNQTGPMGPAGPQGGQGLQGEIGPQGEQGPAGDVGPQGETGAKGDTGDQGPKGDTGLQGPNGDTGATGATGPQGPQGASGAAGLEWVSASSQPSTLWNVRSTADANCPAGKVALAGGFDKSDRDITFYSSMPILNEAGAATGWRVVGLMTRHYPAPWTVTAHALCANAS